MSKQPMAKKLMSQNLLKFNMSAPTKNLGFVSVTPYDVNGVSAQNAAVILICFQVLLT